MAKSVSALYRPICQVFVLIGIATLLLALVTVWQYNSSTKRTNTATGEITAIHKISGIGTDERGKSNQKCHVSYQIVIDGRVYTDELGYRGDATPEKCALAVGDTIDIKYDTSHPANNAYLVDEELSSHRSLSETINSTIAIALVGVISLGIGLFGLHVANDEYSRARDAARKAKSVTKSTTRQVAEKSKAVKQKIIEKVPRGKNN